jgi:hypothetical protein
VVGGDVYDAAEEQMCGLIGYATVAVPRHQPHQNLGSECRSASSILTIFVFSTDADSF